MDLRIAVAVTALVSQGAAPSLQVSNGDVRFVAHGSLGLRVEGRTADLRAVSSPDAIEFQVHLATLDTGIALRDRHMRDEYLQVQSYPLALLRLPRDVIPSPISAGSGSCRGELTLHGQTHPLDVAFRIRRSSGYDVNASMQVDMRDYGIATPKYLGVTVKPDVEVSVDFHLDSP
jgi:polyisoprenoid-binding protein YceI